MIVVGHYAELCSHLRGSAAGLIGVEGFCSSGKSWLADRLGADLPSSVIHLDSYCTPRDDPPPYVDGLDIEGLKHALQKLKPSHFSVVEGICLREALSKCGVA